MPVACTTLETISHEICYFLGDIH